MPLKGSCHCGRTRFSIDVAPETATRCTCTFCTKRGALWAYCEPEKFHLATPLDAARPYSASGSENRHYFCPDCGCTTFSDTPDYSSYEDEESFDPSKRRISINLWALDDFDAAALPVEVIDGRNLW